MMETTFGDLSAWQAMLDRHAELFSEMSAGSRVGFVTRAGSGLNPGKHVAGLMASTGAGDMMAWERQESGMHSSLEGYAGFQEARVDLLFVAEDEALATMKEALHGELRGEALSMIKRQIRKGGIMFYVMKNKSQLQDAGYEEFLESLGLAFLGACR
jgi:hypothetical protein